jgi:hypothetical protein
MTNERKNITQPDDWWKVFEAEAEKRGLTLLEFMGLAASKSCCTIASRGKGGCMRDTRHWQRRLSSMRA